MLLNGTKAEKNDCSKKKGGRGRKYVLIKYSHQKFWTHSQSCQSPHIIFAYIVLQGTLGDTSLCMFSISSPLVAALVRGGAGGSVAQDTFKACSSFYLGGIVGCFSCCLYYGDWNSDCRGVATNVEACCPGKVAEPARHQLCPSSPLQKVRVCSP